jgi:hypothetical protein
MRPIADHQPAAVNPNARIAAAEHDHAIPNTSEKHVVAVHGVECDPGRCAEATGVINNYLSVTLEMGAPHRSQIKR